jgi:GT2 family glycosyltransferase
MRISIIVPVHNNGRELSECLSALRVGSGLDAEILVVDDASTDDTPFVAARMGVPVLRLAKNAGPAAARNYGASHARGEILFFVDADVVVAPGAVDRVKKVFEENPDLAAVFGSYDAKPRAAGVVSQYRNLLHHFVHQNGNPNASTFWGGCGAVRSSAFREIGGFDEKRFRYPSIEDIEMGYRLRHAGHRILLDKSLQATHLKKWTLRSVLRTDIVCRAVPWARLILESKKAPADLNLKWGQRLSGALVMLLFFLMLLGVFWVELLVISAALLVVVIALNRDLYLFFCRQRGFWFAASCIPLHFLYYLYSVLSYIYVWTGFHVAGLATRPSNPIQRKQEPNPLT